MSIDGEIAIAREFATLFANVGRSSLQTLMDAIDRGDVSGVGRSAHEIKGACANLKARNAARSAERLELAAKSSEPYKLKPLADKLSREVCEAIDFLVAKVAGSGAPQQTHRGVRDER